MSGYWYLGSPYSKYPAGLEAAFDDICRVAAQLFAARIPFYCPIAHCHPIQRFATGIVGTDATAWINVQWPLIEAAIGMIVVMMDGWSVSSGLRKEIEIFRNDKKPVLYMPPRLTPPHIAGLLAASS